MELFVVEEQLFRQGAQEVAIQASENQKLIEILNTKLHPLQIGQVIKSASLDCSQLIVH